MAENVWIGWVHANRQGFEYMSYNTLCKVTLKLLSIAEYTWIWLNNAWINCFDYGRVLNMPGQSFAGLWICSQF